MARILVVDDEVICSLVVTSALKDRGHETRLALTGEEAVKSALELVPELIISDWILKGGMTGIDVVRILKKNNPGLKVIFITGLPSGELREQLLPEDYNSILEKPVELPVLLSYVEKLITSDDAAQAL